MAKKFKTIEVKTTVVAVDIPTLDKMSDNEYREFLKGEGLFMIDHQDVLRSAPADYGIAATQEQLNILIEYLGSLRERLRAASDV